MIPEKSAEKLLSGITHSRRRPQLNCTIGVLHIAGGRERAKIHPASDVGMSNEAGVVSDRRCARLLRSLHRCGAVRDVLHQLVGQGRDVLPHLIDPACFDLSAAKARLNAANVDRSIGELRGWQRSGEPDGARSTLAHEKIEPVQPEIERNHAARVHDDGAGRDLRFRRDGWRSVSFFEVCEVRRADESSALQRGRSLPATSDQRCSCSQLGGGTRQSKRLELPGANVVVKVERAHASPFSFVGSDSISRLRSAAFSSVVTSVRPSCTTTTRLSTPYMTTRPELVCTTLSAQSTMWTLPLVTLPNSSLSRTRPKAAQVPMSSQPNLPGSTVTFVLRSRTLESTETGLSMALKKTEA